MSSREKKALEDAIAKAIQENDYFEEVIEDEETLLPVPSRKPLPDTPDVGRKSKLEDMVKFNPKLYEQYIKYLEMGAFFHVAAEAVGIKESTLYTWGKMGKDDYEAEKDTYYSRFYQDTRRAIARCRVVREIAIATADPKRWLSLGPGKIFGNEWVETPTEETAVDDTFTSTREITVQERPNGMKVAMIELDPAEEKQVLEELRKVLDSNKSNKEESNNASIGTPTE